MAVMPRVMRHVLIHGRVQGVGFRAFVEDTARERGVEGWVRNRRAGSVEALFAGPDDVVAAAVEACRHGPRGSCVDRIDQRDGTAEELSLRRPGDAFSVLPTV
jgi:acylphosphatase